MNAYFPELMFVLGLAIGALVSIIINHVRTSFGTLEIDRTNPEKDIYRVFINDLDTLNTKKYVYLAVNSNVHFEEEPRE